MNRATALLLAMAALLAHTLAIHHTGAQQFAPPYDLAHVAYRIARNLVRTGELAWNLAPADGGFSSYPSPLLIAIAALAERLYLPVTTFCQVAGILAMLATVGLSASFAVDRFAGVIPPLLLVTSGAIAGAAASGTELPFVALFAMGAFVAFEHRRYRRLSAWLAGLALASPFGVVLAAALAALAQAERVVPRRDGLPPVPLACFLPVAAIAASLLLLPRPGAASAYGMFFASLSVDARILRTGLVYLQGVAVATATPFLLVVPLVFLALGRLSGAGTRALGLTLVWCACVLAQGGGALAASLAMAPALPLAFVAVQQGIVAALDTQRVYLERLSWSMLALAVAASALASKYPGDLGPLPTYAWHRAWMDAESVPPYGLQPVLGREAITEEIQLAASMRDFATFLRDHLDPGASVLTPWPGALGYLSGLRVIDLFGRTSVLPGQPPNPLWRPQPKTDVVAALGLEPDFVLLARPSRSSSTRAEFGQRLALGLYGLDRDPTVPRGKAIGAALGEYELVTVPVRSGNQPRPWPAWLLRRKDLGLAPALELGLEEGLLRIDLAGHEGDESLRRGHPQLAWLFVSIEDSKGRRWSVLPTGEPVEDGTVCLRTGLVVGPRSNRAVRLAELPLPELPDGATPRRVSAVLLNPGTRVGQGFGPISDPASLEL